mmetsp:Transcript_44859/g.126569  ORF Transcript_44859/g.126569 Transcript_44859/m.126569 type:complete len:179 (+) Transcript_44859:226-762(+)
MATATCTQTQVLASTVLRRAARWGSSSATTSSTATSYHGASLGDAGASGGYGARRSDGTASVDARPSEVGAEDDAAGRGLLPDTATMNLLHCLFAMAFAAVVLGGLTFAGVVVKTSSSTCPAEAGYNLCAAWQDFRSVGSFVLGALLCCLLSHGKETGIAQVAMPDRAEKIQLYAYML